jgi:hypothetical protein
MRKTMVSSSRQEWASVNGQMSEKAAKTYYRSRRPQN